jgi:hypothetical protein
MICPRCGFANINQLHGYSCPSCGGIYSSQAQVNKPPRINKNWETDFAKEYPLSAFLLTVKNIFLRPSSFFKNLTNEGSIFSAWLFALLTCSIGYTFLFFWSNLLTDTLTDFYQDSEPYISDTKFLNAESLLYTPLLVSFQIWIIALYAQFMLIITKTRKASFKSTFKAVSYSQTAMLLNIIPVAGSFFSSIYTIILLLIGLQTAHEKSKLRMFLILTFPLTLLSVFILLIILIILIFGIATTGLLNDLIPFLK